jgi:hypothetical protein
MRCDNRRCPTIVELRQLGVDDVVEKRQTQGRMDSGAADPAGASVRRALLHEQLLDLAQDASSYLRRNARRAVRLSAALLVAASLAACHSTPHTTTSFTSPAVQPLSQEIRSGLPPQSGTYPVVAGSVTRSVQGVYHFAWLPADGSAGPAHDASASLLRLGQRDTPTLEVLTQGDPILYLPANAAVPLVDAAALSTAATPVARAGQSYSTGSTGGMWYPFWAGSYGGVGYYDPPSRVTSSNGVVQGSSVSTAPSAPSSRTVSVPHAVGGRAGGAGGGNAASIKSGAGTGSGSDSGHASAPKSGGFSSGHGGGDAGSGS